MNNRQSASPTKNQKSARFTKGKITALYERLSRDDEQKNGQRREYYHTKKAETAEAVGQ